MVASRTLARWREAGLISAGQAAAIHEYERTRRGERFGRGMTGAALLAIICGVLAVIAANWAEIPGGVKIAAHLLVNAAIACLVWRTADPLRRDGLCVLLFGLTLTLIVLTGQIFQLGGSWSGALILWMLAATPFMLRFGETRLAALPWMAAFIVSILIVAGEYLDDLTQAYATFIIVLIAAFLPIALIADGNIGAFRRIKPVWADLFVRAGFILALVFATIAAFLWDDYMAREIARMADSLHWSARRMQAVLTGIVVLSLAAQGVYAVMKKLYDRAPEEKTAALIAALCTISLALPLIGAGPQGGIAAPVHFIALWALVGWIAQGQGWHRLVSLAIGLIALRVFIVYLELMGGLMTTGLGLISGGAVVLLLIWGARKVRQRAGKAAS